MVDNACGSTIMSMTVKDLGYINPGIFQNLKLDLLTQLPASNEDLFFFKYTYLKRHSI